MKARLEPSVFENIPRRRAGYPFGSGGREANRLLRARSVTGVTTLSRNGGIRSIPIDDRRAERDPDETLSVSRTISGQRSTPLIFRMSRDTAVFLRSSTFRFDSLATSTPFNSDRELERRIDSTVSTVGNARIIPCSYLRGAISTARKPPTLYRAINRQDRVKEGTVVCRGEKDERCRCARDATTPSVRWHLLAISCTTGKDSLWGMVRQLTVIYLAETGGLRLDRLARG